MYLQRKQLDMIQKASRLPDPLPSVYARGQEVNRKEAGGGRGRLWTNRICL